MNAALRTALLLVGAAVLSWFAALWIRTGDLHEAVRAIGRATPWVLAYVAASLLVGLAVAAGEMLWARAHEEYLRLERTQGAVWVVNVRRSRRTGAETVIQRHDITRTVSLSHVNGDVFDAQECVQLHDREPEIQMGLFGEVATAADAELLVDVRHDQLTGDFGRDLAAFLRAQPLIRCEYSLDDDTLWRVEPGNELKPVEPGITFDGNTIIWQAPDTDR